MEVSMHYSEPEGPWAAESKGITKGSLKDFG